MSQIEGFILAGGAGTRMGKNKAFLSLGGKTFLERAAFSLRAVSQNIYAVGDNLTDNLFLPVLPDVFRKTEKRASIVGVHSALFHSKACWTAILACDLPFVNGKLLARLIETGKVRGKSDFDAVAPIQADGRIQPLCAFYKTKACLAQIEEMLANENFRLREIFNRVNARRVSFSEIADLPNAENFFFNVNTPEDLRMANEIENKLSRGGNSRNLFKN